MKKLFIALIATLALTSCNNGNNGNNGYQNAQVVVNQPTVSVTPEVSNLGDNLNLQALGELVKNSTSAQDIEDKLNSPNSINNLDLDNDGKVDYIKVTEYGNGNTRGFSFTVDLANNQSQEIATIEINQGSSNAQMNIQGNQQLYGNNGYYNSNYSLTDLMIMSYLFRPHPLYYSPYHYGYYPRAYRPYAYVPYNSYRSRVSTTTRTTRITRTSTPTRSTITSPNATKTSSLVTSRAKSMAAPTRSQKSFTTTSANRQRPTTSGFRSSSSSSYGSSSRPRSSSSWGGSSSSSRSSSSSSSYRSSGSSSRSSFGSSSRSSFSSGSRRSDERFKKNIKPLKNSLDNVLKLQGVTYDWRINEFPNEKFPDVKQNGLIAQDVEKVFPNLVETRPDGYKQVDYVMLVPSLIEAVKELKDITDKQAKEIKDLKEDLKNEANKREKLVKGLNNL